MFAQHLRHVARRNSVVVHAIVVVALAPSTFMVFTIQVPRTQVAIAIVEEASIFVDDLTIFTTTTYLDSLV